jgi:hypothetical protein
LKCYASIYNETDFNFQTKDIKLLFRSLDHEYNPNENTKNKQKDIPTLETNNILEYNLSEMLPEEFILSKYSNLLLWEQHLDYEEIYQVNILDEYNTYADAYLTFHTKEVLLPGTMEVLVRTEMNDLISAGGLDIKLYHRNEKMKIYFPQSKFIKLKTKLDKKNHSFFLSKKQFHYECKIKFKSKNNSSTKIHFYMNTKDIQKISEEPKYKEGNIFTWEFICNQNSKKSNSKNSHSHSHNHDHEHSHSHSHCSSHHDEESHQPISQDEIFQLDFYREY